jgi:hypothetical protein
MQNLTENTDENAKGDNKTRCIASICLCVPFDAKSDYTDENA